MPWDAASFRSKHNHGLSAKQAGKAAAQANAILRETGDEGMAIAVANKNAKGGGNKKKSKVTRMAIGERPK